MYKKSDTALQIIIDVAIDIVKRLNLNIDHKKNSLSNARNTKKNQHF